MEAHTAGVARPSRTDGSGTVRHTAHRLATETKQAFKTTEFWLTIATVAGILISAQTVDGAEGFGAPQAWLYVAIVVGLYTVGRGLAKSGSREPYTEDDRD